MYKCYTEKQVVLQLDLDCSTILRDMFMLPLNPFELLGKGNVKESQIPVTSFTCHRSTSLLSISGQWQQGFDSYFNCFFVCSGIQNSDFITCHKELIHVQYTIYYICSHCKLFHLALVHKYLSYLMSFNCIL